MVFRRNSVSQSSQFFIRNFMRVECPQEYEPSEISSLKLHLYDAIIIRIGEDVYYYVHTLLEVNRTGLFLSRLAMTNPVLSFDFEV